MTEDQIFETWAPRDGRWSRWVKPVLFSFIDRDLTGQAIPSSIVLDDVGSASETAVVVDLPGIESVSAAVGLLARGWRPVPLFNALPGPDGDSSVVFWPQVVVEIAPIITALRIATPILGSASLSPDAPPAFLLDSRRHGPGGDFQSGTFDNRSVTFPTDFPSAEKLREYGISRVLVIQKSLAPQDDLKHTLRQWQEKGLTIESLQPGAGCRRHLRPIPKVTTLGLWWMRFVAFLTLKRGPHGGYGGILIQPSSS